MSLYCRTDEARANVLEGPRTLPQTYGGISNFPLLSDPELLTFYWYPYVMVDAGTPGQYYNRSVSGLNIQATEVVQTASYEQWSIEEVREIKNSELVSSVVQYQANDLAINPKIADYVNDEAEWVANKQTELARLTDWQAVADFDTTKPDILPLPNSYVGASYARQGIQLTAQNDAALSAGQPAIWDQTLLTQFVASNQAAADDPSNSIPPVGPAYKIRQGVAVPSEQYNRVVIWRFDVEGEVDPNLDRSIAMRITNRQDARDIYTFIYTAGGSTYLGWKKFERTNGLWEWKLDKNTNDGSSMPWTDSDIAFILSYGTNPAEESKFFTDKIDFPAGVEEMNILVAWDAEITALGLGQVKL